MKKARLTLLSSIMCLFLVLVALPFMVDFTKPASAADTAAEFYKDKIVTVISGFSPGGGSDYACRLFASYWPEFSGGAMAVKNMPGAGGVLGANYVYKVKPDGRTLLGGAGLNTLLGPTVLGDPSVKFDLKKVNWIGAISREPWFLSVGKPKPYESMKDLENAKGLKFAALNPYMSDGFFAALVIDVFGLDGKIVSGYGGSSEQGLALGRGEVDGMTLMASGTLANMDRGFLKRPVLVLDVEKTQYFEDLPTLTELVDLTSEQEKLFSLSLMLASVERVFWAPPGTPEDRVQFLRDAFNKMVELKAFQRQHKLYWPVWTEPRSYKDLEAYIEKALAVPKEDVDRLKQLVDKYLAIK